MLGLKLWRPQWFDGVALAVGAASPDVAYVLDGSGLPVWPFSHQWLGLLGWCLPVAIALCWLFRRASPWVSAHLPNLGVLALRDFGALATRRHSWWVTVWSALLGGISHLGLDGVEDRYGAAELWLHVGGAVGTFWVIIHIGRHRLIRIWHGHPPQVATRPLVFWCAAGAIGTAGAMIVPRLPAAFLAHTTGVRLIAVAVLALLVGAGLVRLIPGSPRPRRACRC